MNPWQRLVGTRAEPRRVPNPSMAAVSAAAYLVIGIGWASLGAWAWADGDASGALWRLALGACFLALAAFWWNRRRSAP